MHSQQIYIHPCDGKDDTQKISIMDSQNPPPQNAQQPSQLSLFIARIVFRIKLAAAIVCLWALCFSINTIMKNSIAVEYDGGIADSSKSWAAVIKEGPAKHSKEYWHKLNAMSEKDKKKPLPALACLMAKICGIKVYLLCDRTEESSETIVRTWKRLASEIHFTPDPNDRYEFLEKHKPLLYAASSDENIIQAVKAEVMPIRIKRKEKSSLPGNYNPGKYGEKIIPFSQF